jgi:hypothetical protein
VELRWSESLRCWRSSKSKASFANLTERCYNSLDAACASYPVCSRILHKVDAGAFASNKVLLCCARREFVIMYMALFWDMNPSWLTKHAEGIEIGIWVGNVHKLKQQLMRGLAIRYSCSWAVVYDLNSIAGRMRPLFVCDVRSLVVIARNLSKSAQRVRLCSCSVLSMLIVRPSTGFGAGIHYVYKGVCRRLDLCWPQCVYFGSQEYHRISWNPMEPHGISWNIKESHEIPWNLMNHYGIP